MHSKVFANFFISNSWPERTALPKEENQEVENFPTIGLNIQYVQKFLESFKNSYDNKFVYILTERIWILVQIEHYFYSHIPLFHTDFTICYSIVCSWFRAFYTFSKLSVSKSSMACSTQSKRSKTRWELRKHCYLRDPKYEVYLNPSLM